MVKITDIVLGAFVVFGCFAPSLLADATMGADIFKKEMRTVCGFSGNVMAKKHTQNEWKHLYEAGTHKAEMLLLCPDAKPLSDASLKHLYDFLYHFAIDSGNTALCY